MVNTCTKQLPISSLSTLVWVFKASSNNTNKNQQNKTPSNTRESCDSHLTDKIFTKKKKEWMLPTGSQSARVDITAAFTSSQDRRKVRKERCRQAGVWQCVEGNANMWRGYCLFEMLQMWALVEEAVKCHCGWCGGGGNSGALAQM